MKNLSNVKNKVELVNRNKKHVYREYLYALIELFLRCIS